MSININKKATPATPSAGVGQLFYSSTLSPAALAFIDESANILRVGGLTTKDFRLIKVTHITQGTVTYTPTSGTTRVFVQGVGGGGGGGACATAATNSAAAGGGGSGGYAELWFTYTSGAITVQVGAGGAGGVAGANNGTAGTDTTFSAGGTFTAKGGLGGIADTVAATFPEPRALGGVGGPVGTSADFTTGGGAGSMGIAFAAAKAMGGDGAASYFGGGGPGSKNQGAGSNALGTGAGGGGAAIVSGGASVAGGNGSNGILICWEFA